MTNWNALYDRLRAKVPSLELRRDEPMSRHTSFKVGGPVPLMALPKTRDEAMDAIYVAGRLGIVPSFLGNGSDLLVADEGYDGYIIKTSGLDRLEWVDLTYSGPRLVAGSGVPLSRLANFAAEQGFTGLEWAAGIPGTVGGGVYMNAGAYGGEMSQVLDKISFMVESGDVLMLSAKACEFSYRRSIFSRMPKWMVLNVSLLPLERSDPAEIRAKMADLAARRKEKQPLEYPSAGSTFKRPAPVDGRPVYAAAVIEQCGLKGLSVGSAQVSEKHAGFIVNRGGATCKDIIKLMAQVRERVFQETGVALEPEVRCLGKEGDIWNS